MLSVIHSSLVSYICEVIKSPTAFTFSAVLSLQVCPLTIKVFLPTPAPFFKGAVHMRKNTRLSLPAQFQCSYSGAGEPGNRCTVFTCM